MPLLPKAHRRVTLLLAGILLCGAALGASNNRQRPPFVVEQLDVAYRFENDGTYTHAVRARLYVATEEGRRALGEFYFPYHEHSSRVELRHLRTVKPSGETIEAETDQLFDVAPPAGQQSPVFSDLKYKAIPVPGLQVGDRIEYEKITTHHTPLVPGQFWGHHTLTRHVIVGQETVRLDLPADRALAVEFEHGIDHTVENHDGRQIHRWNHTNPVPRPPEQNLQQLFNLSTFRTWPELGTWMNGLVADRAVGDEALAELARELVGDATEPHVKIERLYTYVAQSVRYVRIALGIGSYQPHTATSIQRNQYGDCKDKHTLLATLLNAVGIEAWPAMVHSSGRVDPRIPTPEAFDHLITVVRLGPPENERLWLDATEELAPAGWLTSNLRGGGALVVQAQGSKLEKVPTTVPVPDARRALLRGSIGANGDLRADLRIEHQGSFEVGWRTLFHKGRRNERETALLFDRPPTLRDAAAGATTTSDPLDTSGPFVVEYSLEQSSWVDTAVETSQVKLPSMILGSFAHAAPRSASLLGAATGLAGREFPTTAASSAFPDGELVGPMLLEERVLLETPPGLAVEPPPDVLDQRDFATYTATYVVKDGNLEATRTLTIENTRLKPARREDVATFMRSLQDDLARSLTIVRQAQSDAE